MRYTAQSVCIMYDTPRSFPNKIGEHLPDGEYIQLLTQSPVKYVSEKMSWLRIANNS